MQQSIKDTLNIRVINNTNFPQNVNMLGGTSDPLAIPPHLLYQWDLSTETYYGTVTATIIISSTTNPTPITYTIPVNGYNIQAVVSALNSLNLGIFQVSGNIIYVSNDFYIYGALTILSTAFVSTWQTATVTGSSSANNQIKLPLNALGTYNFTVFWGDGTQNTITSWNQAETLHTYAAVGSYTIGIVGTITEWSFGNSIVDDNQKFLSISSWGTLQFGVLVDSNFSGCINLELQGVTDVPDLSATTTLQNTFDTCTSLTTINRSNEWDTSNITNMVGTFKNCSSFNSDISTWNVSNVNTMQETFSNATSFNQPLNTWDVSNVTNMLFMFLNATSFNQDLNSWNTSNVTTIQSIFLGASSFNGDISSWDMSNVVNMASAFNNASSFNQNISGWNVSNVINFVSMFDFATNFNQAIGSWNVGNATNMSLMFKSALAFNQNIGSWNVSSVINLSGFMNGKSFTNYSSANLDSIYNGWSLLTVQPNLINVDFGTIKYTLAGQPGKNILTGPPNNWAIIDGGI